MSKPAEGEFMVPGSPSSYEPRLIWRTCEAQAINMISINFIKVTEALGNNWVSCPVDCKRNRVIALDYRLYLLTFLFEILNRLVLLLYGYCRSRPANKDLNFSVRSGCLKFPDSTYTVCK